MRYMKTKRIISLIVLLAIAAVAPAALPAVRAAGDNRAPDLPLPLCDKIQAPQENKVIFHVYARGFQIYRWNGATWVSTPSATLFADADYTAQVGTHYAGPTWESNSGSYVKAARKDGCSPDPTAIPWLLLQSTSTGGPGIFSSVTSIQRVNTTGGLPPTYSGTTVDESVEVAYTAEYYFYRAED